MSADRHRGQRVSAGNCTDYAIKAKYKDAADIFATQHKFFLLSGRHPYKKIMGTPLRDIVAVQAETWSGITQPNEAAGVMAEELMSSIKGFEALRGQLRFEDEPSSFEAALQETKEVLP